MLDLTPEELGLVRDILRAHVPGATVRAFGSRAQETAKTYSDLDLAVDAREPLSLLALDNLRNAFQESALRFRVDVVDWHRISGSFRELVERSCQPLSF